jgi:di- and tripeptidase
VLLSNSTWIDEGDPCVVFGMRGVVYANLAVSTARDDAHSGVDGGIVAEPMFDMVRVLGAIADANGVKLPGFCEWFDSETIQASDPSAPVPADRADDNVSPPTPDETKLLEDVAKSCGRSVDDLVKVWRQPSFSIANISSSGASNKTVIPKKVSADISMRIVPEQVGGALSVICRQELVPRRKAGAIKDPL